MIRAVLYALALLQRPDIFTHATPTRRWPLRTLPGAAGNLLPAPHDQGSAEYPIKEPSNVTQATINNWINI